MPAQNSYFCRGKSNPKLPRGFLHRGPPTISSGSSVITFCGFSSRGSQGRDPETENYVISWIKQVIALLTAIHLPVKKKFIIKC